MDKFINFFIAFFICVALFLQASFSFANDKKQFYALVGLGTVDYGITTSDLQSLNTSLVNLGYSSSYSTTDNAGLYWKAHGGMSINEYLAIEGGYTSLGTLTIDTTLTGPAETVKTELSGKSFEITGLAKYTFTEGNYAYFRLGAHFWDLDTSITTTKGSGTFPVSSGSDVTYGLGYHWKVGGKSGFRVEYQGYQLGSGDINTFHISYVLGL